MKILIAGGGTGGHLVPAMTVARTWLETHAGAEVLLVGARRPLDRKLLGPSGLPHRLIPAGGLKGKTFSERLRSAVLLLGGVAASFWILFRFRPRVVLGVGGYASAPAVLAAWCTGRPVVLMEQNAHPGAANRFLSRFAKAAALGFPEAQDLLGRTHCVVTGVPLRPEIEALAAETRSEGGGEREADPASGSPPTLLVFGGSQGSHALNEALCRALPAWKARGLSVSVIHVTGEADAESVRRAHREAGFDAEVSPFLEDMAAAYRKADLAIARAGAVTVSELMAAGVPAILVPMPAGADHHQAANAAAAAGAALTIPQEELEARLGGEAAALLEDPARLRAMSAAGRAKAMPGAAARIARLCRSVADGGEPDDRDPH